jgi:hypothetical protein
MLLRIIVVEDVILYNMASGTKVPSSGHAVYGEERSTLS